MGESERSVRLVFSRARTSSPCVIFFDELDALVPPRNDALSESSSRVVNTLLTELDGLEARGGVYVIGATNRPDRIDAAMRRPGRLDKLLYVDLPGQGERLEILRTITQKMPLLTVPAQSQGAQNSDKQPVDLEELSRDRRLSGFSGADLANLAREAAVCALRSALLAAGQHGGDARAPASASASADGPLDGQAESSLPRITHQHFLSALEKVGPSVGPEDRARYMNMRLEMSQGGMENVAISNKAPLVDGSSSSSSNNGATPKRSRKATAGGGGSGGGGGEGRRDQRDGDGASFA